MLKISFLEFIVRGIPEGLLFTLAVYTFSKKVIESKRYLLSSILDSVIVYLIRFLPIQKGADTILNLIVLIALTVIINKIDIIKSIKAGIMVLLLMFICEGVNVFILQFILKKDLNYIFNEPILKILYGIPSLIILGCIVIPHYIILWRRKELKYIEHGKLS